jgi:hypothetical protein
MSEPRRVFRSVRFLRLGVWLSSAALAACGGGGGGSSPTAPGSPLAAAGTWAAVETLVSASPAGNCWADQLNLLRGIFGNYVVTIDQNDTMVTLVIASNTSSPDTTYYRGTVGSSALTAEETQGVPEFPFDCGNGRTHVTIRDIAGSLSLTGSSSRLSGTLSETFALTDRTTGAGEGQVTVNYTLVLSR